MEVRKETTVPSLGPVGYLEERGAWDRCGHRTFRQHLRWEWEGTFHVRSKKGR